MNIGTTKKVLCLLAVVWLGVMVYLWFPNLFPLPNLTKEKQVFKDQDQGFVRAKEFQKMRYNVTKLTDTVHVCIISDKETLGGMIALINSIDRNSKHPVMFHLVVDTESLVHVKSWIANSRLHDIMYEVKIFPEEWVKGKIMVRRARQELASPLNYARYYLPQLFPDLNRIIYLDSDVIVQGDLYELYTSTISAEHWAVFAEDCTGSAKRVTLTENVYSAYIDFKNKHVQHMDMNPLTCSFNTGVYVTDLDVWRKNNITQKLDYWLQLNTKEEVYGNERGGGGSQPPMMIVFYNKYTKMNPSWHVRYLGMTRGTTYMTSFLKQSKLLHWSGLYKPWGRRAQHSELWDQYFITDPKGEFVPIRKS